jgi:RNA polymerase sigma factor (sigma-70 family)
MRHEDDPLEGLLDEQSDSDFGAPEFKAHFQHNLADWTAQDFSNIYVRFYPHVLRHAKRYLTNHSQAEEVVQDAFLYLLTSLPEIDSEVGVLKLLKWKVRLLALDVIKINSRASLMPVEDEFDLASEDLELDEKLIQADEAAIVSLALAKLNPRQREALVAVVYQEKETPVVAQQLGLSENATRQLLFRAKSAFRKALVGEAETAGMSVSQILSVAAKKARQDAGKTIGVASAFLIVMAVSLGFIPNFSQTPVNQIAATSPENAASEVPAEEPRQPEVVEAIPEEQSVLAEELEDSESPQPGAIESEEPSDQNSTSTVQASAVTESPVERTTEPTLVQVVAAPTRPQIQTASLSPFLDLSVDAAEVVFEKTEFFPNATSVIKVHSGVGLWAYVDYDPISYAINAVAFEVMIDGERYFAAPRSFGTATTESGSGFTLTYSATELFLIDDERNVISDHGMASSFVTVTLQLDAQGQPVKATLFVKS